MKGFCVFCETSSVDELLGPFYQIANYTFHSNCLVFSSDIRQSSDKSIGVNGFGKETIDYTLNRARKRKCTWCWRVGATVRCTGDEESSCEAIYHFPCALDTNQTTHESFDRYQSYCSEHNPHRCIFDYEPITGIVIRTDCCWQVYSHDDCIEKYVRVSKALTKCPLCYDVENFKYFIAANFTVKISNKNPLYARWSDSGYAMQCAAKICICMEPGGRFHHQEDGSFELIDCFSCGSDSIHRTCGNIEMDNEWICSACTLESIPSKTKAVTVKKPNRIKNMVAKVGKWILIKVFSCAVPHID